jgi:FkbM family methyltransferase
MRQLVTKLSRSAVLRKVVRSLRLNRLGNAWLRKFPSIKTLAGSGIRYRATRLESIPLAVEMFEKNALYDASLLPKGFTTFIDLGCNVGYFSCWMMHLAEGRKVKGLMVDANPEAVSEAAWHAQANGMADLHGLNGIVGEGAVGAESEFYLYESNICSTSHLPDIQAMGLTGEWRKIRVPCLSISAEWTKRFGSERCHVLKLDVEGSELRFLRAEASFLELCDSVLVEWHKWEVSFSDLEALLQTKGFQHQKTLEEGDQMGTAFFVRSS